MAKSVYLSPSTQEKNIGVLNYGTEEKRANQICDITEKILKQHGVVIYRNKPTMTLTQAIEDSNKKKANIHFAIHTNAYNRKSRGCEVFCYKFKTEGHKLASSIYSEIEHITPTTDRGVKSGYNYYGEGKHMAEVAKTTMPAALVEIAFHDNEEDVKWILSNIELIGIALAKGVLKYFGIKFIDNSIKVLYKVQVGAFSKKDNAEDMICKLKKAGFDGFIVKVNT
jgi:N-acetylmuramoyl-L-alanine amidase